MAANAFHFPMRWTKMPTGPVKIRPYWISRGLKSFYLYRSNQWYWDMVTNSLLGANVGSGPTFKGDRIASTGSTTSYAAFPINTDLNSAFWSVLIGARFLANGIGSPVFWSILRNNSNWFGAYGSGPNATIGVNTVQSNVFDGGCVQTQLHTTWSDMQFHTVTCNPTSSSMRGFFGPELAADASITPISGGAMTTMRIGGSRRDSSTMDNTASAEFQYFGVANQLFNDGEMFGLSTAPYGELFVPRQQIMYFDVSTPSVTARSYTYILN